MLKIFADCYQLPNHPIHKRYNDQNKEKQTTDQPYDELFIWSLLLYSGNNDEDLSLPRMFWSKSKKPITCCLAAMIVFQNLREENFVPDYLKEEMEVAIKWVELIIIPILLSNFFFGSRGVLLSYLISKHHCMTLIQSEKVWNSIRNFKFVEWHVIANVLSSEFYK